MSSGRDIHSPEYHQKQQDEFRKTNQYFQEPVIQPAHPGLGLLPSHTPACGLAHNWIDIESTLLGIGANDLVNPSRSLAAIPDIKKVPILNMVDRAPLVLAKTQKPLKQQRLRYYLGGQSIPPRYEKVQTAAAMTTCPFL